MHTVLNFDARTHECIFIKGQIDMITPDGVVFWFAMVVAVMHAHNTENELLKTQKSCEKKNSDAVAVAAAAFSAHFMGVFFSHTNVTCYTCVRHDVICIIFHAKRKQRTKKIIIIHNKRQYVRRFF